MAGEPLWAMVLRHWTLALLLGTAIWSSIRMIQSLQRDRAALAKMQENLAEMEKGKAD